MKKAGLFLLLIVCLSVAYGQKRKVLFIGNSYTRVNDLPLITSGIAMNMGDTLIYDVSYPDGYTLEQHFSYTPTLNKIKAGGWDYVVLQEQSQRPSFPEYDFFWGIDLCATIKKYNPCARILFYMTWGRKNGDQQNCGVWPPVCTYEGMDSLLRERYIEMAQLTETAVSPVGAAWRHSRKTNSGIELYDPDQSHPSIAGTYLAACSFYTSIFRKNPTLISYTGGLNSNDATAIRQAVKAVVYDSLTKWEYRNNQPKAEFSFAYGNGNNEIATINTSTRFDSTLWDFGDGNYSTVFNPNHQYLAAGLYTIKLKVTNCDLGTVYTSQAQQTVRFCNHNPRITPDNLVLCPSATDTLWTTQPYDAYQWLDDNGDTIPGATQPFLVASPGRWYSVLATHNGCTEQSPLVRVGRYNNLGFYSVYPSGNFIGADSLCQGDTLILVLQPNKPPFPPDSSVEWYKDGVLIPNSANDTLLVTTSGVYKGVFNDETCNEFKYEGDTVRYAFVYCGGVGIDPNTRLPISLYPNPASNVLEIQTLAQWQGSAFTITNMLGETVISGSLNDMATVAVTAIPAGVYILHLQNQAVRFIKE